MMPVQRFTLPRLRPSGRNFLICFFFFALTGREGLFGGIGVATAKRLCYYCGWAALGPGDYKLVRSAIGGKDDCRPGNFNYRNAKTVTCDNECITLILYDYIETDSLLHSPYGIYPRGFLPSRKHSFREFDPNRTVVMTFFFRGCAKHPPTRQIDFREDVADPNEAGMHVFQQKYFCSAPLCNNETVPYNGCAGFPPLGALTPFWVLPIYLIHFM